MGAATQHPLDTPTADDPDQGKGTAILYRLMIVDDRTASPDVLPMSCRSPALDRSADRLRKPLGVATVLLAAALAACSGPVPSAYETERFNLDSTRFARHFGESAQQTCDAARRALLSQGYIISEPRLGMLNGRKSFQPRIESHIQIDFTVSCIADGRRPEDGATAFVSAVQERYALKKSSSSASVGVGPVGTISVPFGSTDEAMVKVASETVAAPSFYERFFQLMEHYLASLDEEDPPPPPPAEIELTPPKSLTDPAPVLPGPGQSDPGQPVPARPEPVRSDPGQSDPG